MLHSCQLSYAELGRVTPLLGTSLFTPGLGRRSRPSPYPALQQHSQALDCTREGPRHTGKGLQRPPDYTGWHLAAPWAQRGALGGPWGTRRFLQPSAEAKVLPRVRIAPVFVGLRSGAGCFGAQLQVRAVPRRAAGGRSATAARRSLPRRAAAVPAAQSQSTECSPPR